MKCKPRYLYLATALAAGLIAGCGGGGEKRHTSSQEEPAAPPPTASGTGKRPGQRIISIPAKRPAGVSRRLPREGAAGSFEGIDFAAYDATLNYSLFLVNRYWSKNYPGPMSQYSPPARVIAYYPLTAAPRCEVIPEAARDADYCAPDNFVAFDEPGFMIPFYKSIGPTADATVLAHEWGHVIQTRLGLNYEETVEKELNADCMAGVWAEDAVEKGVVPNSEIEESKLELLKVGDTVGIAWQDPTAHGTGPQRIKAFMLGFDGGARTCLTKLRPGFSLGHPGVVP